MKAHVPGVRATQGDPVSGSFITSAETASPDKVIFTGSEVRMWPHLLGGRHQALAQGWDVDLHGETRGPTLTVFAVSPPHTPGAVVSSYRPCPHAVGLHGFPLTVRVPYQEPREGRSSPIPIVVPAQRLVGGVSPGTFC